MIMVLSSMSGFIYVYDAVTYSLEWKSKELGRDVLGVVLADVDKDGQVEIIAGQGGYVGKGDYTSGYVTPHVYIIDGKTKKTEAVLGEIDETSQWLAVAIIVGVALALIQIAIISRILMRKRRLYQ